MNFGNKKSDRVGGGGRLGIATRQDGKAMVVQLQGEVDLNVSPALREQLKSLTAAQHRLIVIDMSGVPYIDSSGVATLVECLQGLARYGGELRLAALGERTRSVFEISRLDSVFNMHATVDEALRA